MKQVGGAGRITRTRVAVLLIASFTVAMAHAEDDETPAEAAAYISRGNAYNNLGQYEEALLDYTKAIELDPAYASAYRNRGGAYMKMDDEESALSDYQKASELETENERTKQK